MTGARRFSGVGSLGPVNSFSRSTICTMPPLIGAVGEDDAVILHAGRDHAVQIGRHRAGRAGLLADQTELADFHGL